jgi:serine/threonine protein kinase
VSSQVQTQNFVGDHISQQLGLSSLQVVGGGFGSQVYKGRTELGDFVAVKVFSPSITLELTLEAWRDVALACSHPHIVRTLDVGPLNTGRSFATMEYIEGTCVSLFARRRLHELAQPKQLGLLRDLGRAIGYLHGMGLIHRDIHLGNILVARDAQLKLLDLELLCPEQTDYKQRFRKCGVAPFTAPELYDSNHQASKLSDIFSYCVICFYLLTGVYPWDDIAAARPSSADSWPLGTPKSIANILPELDERLAATLMNGLNQDPTCRPQDICEIVALISQGAEHGAPA